MPAIASSSTTHLDHCDNPVSPADTVTSASSGLHPAARSGSGSRPGSAAHSGSAASPSSMAPHLSHHLLSPSSSTLVSSPMPARLALKRLRLCAPASDTQAQRFGPAFSVRAYQLYFSDTTARQHKCLGPSHRRASQQRQHLAATLFPQPNPAACSLQFTLDIRAHAPRQHAPSSTMDICSPITCLSHSKHRGSIPAAPFLRRHSSTTAPVCPSPMIQALVAAISPILRHEMRLTQATIPASRC